MRRTAGIAISLRIGAENSDAGAIDASGSKEDKQRPVLTKRWVCRTFWCDCENRIDNARNAIDRRMRR